MVTPLGDPCFLPGLSGIACVTSDESWTSSKFRMGESSGAPVAAVPGLVSEQSQPRGGTQGRLELDGMCSGPPLWPGPPNAMEKDNKTRQITALKQNVYCWLVPSAFLSLQILGGGS